MGLFEAVKAGIMKVWYAYVRMLSKAFPYRTIEGRRFSVHPGVYKPLENEHSVAEYCNPDDTVLNIGCGCGAEAVFVGEKAKSVLAVDLSKVAVENTLENLKTFDITNVEVRQSDMFDNVDGTYSLILANPPYIAADFADEEENYATSVRYLPILFAEVENYMDPDARLMVQFPAWFAKRLIGLAESHGFKLVERKPMPSKSLGLALLSLAYMQIGFRSTFFHFERA